MAALRSKFHLERALLLIKKKSKHMCIFFFPFSFKRKCQVGSIIILIINIIIYYYVINKQLLSSGAKL